MNILRKALMLLPWLTVWPGVGLWAAGEFGVGIALQVSRLKSDNGVKALPQIREVFKGTTAEGKLRAGDLLLQVDGNATSDRTLAQTEALLYGPPNTTARLLVQRAGQPVQVEVKRERLRPVAVADVGALPLPPATDYYDYMRQLSRMPADQGAKGMTPGHRLCLLDGTERAATVTLEYGYQYAVIVTVPAGNTPPGHVRVAAADATGEAPKLLPLASLTADTPHAVGVTLYSGWLRSGSFVLSLPETAPVGARVAVLRSPMPAPQQP